jgi:hypothetical protein
VDAGAPAARQAAPEKDWWLRALAVFQSPSTVFMALRDDSDAQATARQEPVLALVWLAGISGVLATPSAGTLLDNSDLDGLLVAVLVFLAGGMYGLATYFLGGGAVYLGARAAGGTGSYRRARHLLAYAAAPLVLLLVVVWPVRLAVYGDDVFRTGGADATGAGRWVFESVEAAVFAWAFVLLVVGIRAVHGWRLVRSLGSLVLAALALLAFGVGFSWVV